MLSCGLNTIEGDDYMRHPLVYLVEAADDICYSLFDFEDFVHLGFVTEDTYCDTLIKIILANGNSSIAKKTHGSNLAEKLANYKQSLYHDNNLNFANIASKLRSEAIFQMILNASDVFKQKYEHIMSGVYTIENQLLNKKGKVNGLLDIHAEIIKDSAILDNEHPNEALRHYSINYGYNNVTVLKNSLGGYEVMSQLLRIYIAALHSLNKLNSQMVLFAIPEEYLFKSIKESLSKRDIFTWVEILSTEQQIEQVRLLNDYLTGLTDTAALKLFRHIKGHEQITIF